MAPPETTLRAAREEDAARLSELAFRSKAHWGYSTDFMEACRDALTLRAGSISRHPTAVAEQTGEPLGFCQLQTAAEGGVIEMLFVAPQAIGQGVGGLLLDWALLEAKRRRWAVLDVDSDPHARAFYEHGGARWIADVPSDAIAGRNLPRLRYTIGA